MQARKITAGAPSSALAMAGGNVRKEPTHIESGEIRNKDFRADKIPGMRPRPASGYQRKEPSEKAAYEEAHQRLNAYKPKSDQRSHRDIVKVAEPKKEEPTKDLKQPGSLARLIQGKQQVVVNNAVVHESKPQPPTPVHREKKQSAPIQPPIKPSSGQYAVGNHKNSGISNRVR